MVKQSMDRRKFVSFSTVAGGSAAIAATVHEGAARKAGTPLDYAKALQDALEVKYATVVEGVPPQFAEAPMLAEMVNAGDLPPVEERLPEEPLVVQPIEIGKYGGTIHLGDVTTELYSGDSAFVTGAQNHFLRYNPDLTGTVPNIAKRVDVSDDFTTYTIHLRKGMKWSDGEPVTSADVLFTYEDILLNQEITPSMYKGFRPNDQPMEVTAPDDYTVVITFTVPVPRFLLSNLPHQYGWPDGREFHPRHYLEQFHIAYNENAKSEAEEAGYSTWVERFQDMDNESINIDSPTLRAMIPVESTSSYVRHRRNPYFWAVDTDGNQLPYIDNVDMTRLQDVETYHAQIVTGALDYAVFNAAVTNFPIYQASEESGDYRVLRYSSGKGSELLLQVNMNWPEPELRKLHQDKRYRQALSVAINRAEINDVLFFGSATPRQITVLPTSVYFKQEYADAWAQFDVDLANSLLDELGLIWNDDQTMRLLPNGDPLRYDFDYWDGEGPKTQILELVTAYWREIGIDAAGSPVTRQLLDPRVETNQEPLSLWHGDAATDILFPVQSKWVIGEYGIDWSAIAPLWIQWWGTNGESGEQPPEWYIDALDVWQRFSETLDPELAADVLQSQADNLWSIGTVGVAPWPFIVKNRVGNVPETGIEVWDGLFQYPYFPETLFLRDS